MRMRELEEKSGMSRTAIHHYLREGLLPPPDKTAANAALYSETHVERLRQIRELRFGQLGRHSLPSIKRILGRIDSGTSPIAAVSLEQMVDSEVAEQGPYNSEDLAGAAGVEVGLVGDLVEAGLLVDRGPGRTFDESDLTIVRTCARLFDTTPLEFADLTPIVELIGGIVRYERSLAGLVSTAEPDAGHAGGSLERALGVLHAYLFARTPGK